MLLAVWLIVTLSFAMLSVLPGDPARLILGYRADARTLDVFRMAAGLDAPLAVRYQRFLLQSATLDFGSSLAQRRPVRTLIASRAPQTARLAAIAVGYVVAFALFLPLLETAIFPAAVRYWTATFWGGVATLPPYVLAVATLLVFGSVLHWIPLLFEPGRWQCWLLPAFVLAAYPIAIVSKILQQQLAQAQAQPYVLRARASGFLFPRILISEILPNVLTPPLAALANSLAFFVTGTFFVEVVFGIPGLGGLTYEAIRSNDLPLLLGLCVLFAVATTVVSGLLEISLIFINPKLRRGNA